MGKSEVFEGPDGKRYMSTKTAGELFGVSKDTVARYCSDGRIAGAFKDSSRRWFIPFDAVKPMTQVEIGKILMLSTEIEYDKSSVSIAEVDSLTSEHGKQLRDLYGSLALGGYIHGDISEIDDSQLPYNVRLTKKGLDLIAGKSIEESESKKKRTIDDWLEVVSRVVLIIEKAYNIFVN